MLPAFDAVKKIVDDLEKLPGGLPEPLTIACVRADRIGRKYEDLEKFFSFFLKKKVRVVVCLVILLYL